MGKALRVRRAVKATSVAGAASVVLLIVLLASGAAGAPVAAGGRIAAAPSAPVLPVPGNPGFPPKLDGPAIASQEILPNLVSLFPGIPTVPADPGFPAVRQVSIGGATHQLLVFDSGFKNSGPGPVLVWGHRANTATADMKADQYIKLKNGSYALRRNVGVLRYIYPFGIGLPHLHWHYLGAEVYALYAAGHFGQFRRSHKQGFCMADPDFANYCGYKQTTELTQIEGMFPHTADYYGALVEGQDIDITGLRAGKYVLVNWLDSQCQLEEKTYADNAASTAFTLTYPAGSAGVPTITVGAELNGVPHPPCPAPSMDAAQAAHYLREAAAKESGGSVTALRSRCTRASATGFTCHASWNRGHVAYAGRMSIAYVASRSLGRYATAVAGISARTLFDGKASGRHVRSSASLRVLPS
jgi:hypothetical protein